LISFSKSIQKGRDRCIPETGALAYESQAVIGNLRTREDDRAPLRSANAGHWINSPTRIWQIHSKTIVQTLAAIRHIIGDLEEISSKQLVGVIQNVNCLTQVRIQ
jgi:hypothetical protein